MIPILVTIAIAAWALSNFLEVANRDKTRRTQLAKYFRQRFMKL